MAGDPAAELWIVPKTLAPLFNATVLAFFSFSAHGVVWTDWQARLEATE